MVRAKHPSLTSSSFYHIGGTLRPDAPCYVERAADQELFAALQRGEFCYVLTSRQLGKSSLMARVAARLRGDGVQVASIDLTALGENQSAEQWYNGLLAMLGFRLDLEEELETFWAANQRLGPLRRWMAALREVVLPKLGAQCPVPSAQLDNQPPHAAGHRAPSTEHRLVIFLDEIDCVRSLPFSTDELFAAIRECYNRRTEDPVLERLTFCLLGVATPSDLIQDPRRTPFNIGRRIELNDFTEAEAAPLAEGLLGVQAFRRSGVQADERRTTNDDLPNARTPECLSAEYLLRRILYWTGGHPYLTQRLCQGVAVANAASPKPEIQDPQLVDRLCEEMFLSLRAREADDNLLFVRQWLLQSDVDRASLLDIYRQMLRGPGTPVDPANPLVDVLRLSGIACTTGARRQASGVRPDKNGWRRKWHLSMPFTDRLTPDACLKVRNPIYERVFDRDWVTQHMPDAELRRQRAAYHRGLVRAASVWGAVAVVMAWLAVVAVGNAQQAQAASENAQKSQRVTEDQNHQLEKLTAQLQKALLEKTAEQQRADQEKRHAQQAQRDERQQRQRAVAARMTADRERRRAERQRRFALAQRSEAVKQREASRARLVKLNVANGMRLAEEGDLLGSLPWLAQALTLERDNPARAEMHRIRLAAMLQQCPKLSQVWFHDQGVVVARFSRDGQRVLTASWDGVARVWNAATGEAIGPPLKHGASITWAAISPDGLRVATTDGQTAQVWEIATGRRSALPLPNGSRIRRVAFSPDGRRVVTAGGDRTARVWDATTGQPITAPIQHKAAVSCAEFSPDGRRIVTALNSPLGETRVWDATTGEPLTLPMEQGGFGYRALQHVEFSPDGRRIVTASNDFTARVWDAATGRPVTPPLQHGVILHHAAFSPDSRRIATAGGTAVRVWDAETGRELTPPMRHGDTVRFVAFSPDGSRLVSAGAEKTVRVWDASTGQPVGPPLKHPAAVSQATFSPDGRRILTAGVEGVARVWDLATGESVAPIVRHHGHVTRAAFSPDGRRILTVSSVGTARAWDAVTAQPLTAAMKHNVPGPEGEFSRDGRRIVTFSRGGQAAQIWDVTTGRAIGSPLQHEDRVPLARFSPDGRWVITSSSDLTVRAWDAATGRPLFAPIKLGKPPPDPERFWWNGVAFSPDSSRFVTASNDNTARVWDTETGKPLTPPMGHGDWVETAIFSPDGRRILTCSKDKMARVWDAATGRPLTPPLRHERWWEPALFVLGGRRVLTVGGDTIPRVWDATTGKPLNRPRKSSARIGLLALSPDGRRVAAVSGVGTVRVWDAATGRPLTPPMPHSGGIQRVAFSPDGRLVGTASQSDQFNVGQARVWDAATGEPITLPLKHPGWVSDVAFSPDGRRVVTTCLDDETARVWDLPRDGRPAEDLLRLAELLAGHEIDETAGFVPLTTERLAVAWRTLRPKYPGAFAASPEQALGWHQREADEAIRTREWAAAVAHFEAWIAAKPGQWTPHSRRAEAFAELGRWENVVTDATRAIQLGSDDAHVWHHLAIARLALGDAEGYRATCAEMLDRFGRGDTFAEANLVATTCALAPNAVPDLTRPLGLGEILLARPESQESLNTVGAALYRAGRYGEALERLRAATQRSYGGNDGRLESGIVYTRLFLAMCHQRLGHAPEARQELQEAIRQLEDALQPPPSAAGGTARLLPWWHRLEFQLLRREAEALIGLAGQPTPRP